MKRSLSAVLRGLNLKRKKAEIPSVYLCLRLRSTQTSLATAAKSGRMANQMQKNGLSYVTPIEVLNGLYSSMKTLCLGSLLRVKLAGSMLLNQFYCTDPGEPFGPRLLGAGRAHLERLQRYRSGSSMDAKSRKGLPAAR
jgi:hypothetical protein